MKLMEQAEIPTQASGQTIPVNTLVEEETNGMDANGDEGQIEERFDLGELSASFDKMKARIETVDDSEAQNLKVNVITAVGNAFCVARSFLKDKALFEENFQKSAFDVATHEDLPDLAKSYLHTCLKIKRALNIDAELPNLIEEARPLHAKLMRAAVYLWENDHELGTAIGRIRPGRGKIDMVHDIANICDLFEERWDDAEHNCELTLAEVTKARALSLRIIELMRSAQTEADVDKWKLIRDKTGTLIRRSMDAIRKAAGFVFDNNPVDLERYPSLFSGKRAKKTSKPPAPETGATPPEPATSPTPEMN